MNNFEKTEEWNVRFEENIIHAIGYEKRGIFGVPVAEIRNNQYISVDVIAIERGYVNLHNSYSSVTMPNFEERKILEKLGYIITPAGFVTIKE